MTMPTCVVCWVSSKKGVALAGVISCDEISSTLLNSEAKVVFVCFPVATMVLWCYFEVV
jgi:hypothetical protein